MKKGNRSISKKALGIALLAVLLFGILTGGVLAVLHRRR